MSGDSLIAIKPSEVPEYLHASELYLSFDPEEIDDELSVPSNCMKLDLTIRDVTDLDHLLLTMRYWILDRFPTEAIIYLLNSCSSEYMSIFQNYQTEFSSVQKLLEAIEIDTTNVSENLRLACKYGRIDFVDYFVSEGARLTTFLLQAASDNGKLNCLRYVYQQLESAGPVTVPASFFYSAVQRGQLACLQFFILDCQVNWNKELCNYAVRQSQLACLRFLVENLHQQGDTVKHTIWYDAVGEYNTDGIDFLLYLLEVVPVDKALTFLPNAACRAGNVRALQHLVNEGFAVSYELVSAAAKSGSFECLQFLHETLHFDCWVPATMAAAAGAGHLLLVKQLHEMGCPWDDTAPIEALRADEADCLTFLICRRGVPTCTEFTSIPPGRRCKYTCMVFEAVHDVLREYKFAK